MRRNQVSDEAAYNEKFGYGEKQISSAGLEITHNGNSEMEQSTKDGNSSKVPHRNKRRSKTSSVLKWLSRKFHLSSKRIEEDFDRGICPSHKNTDTLTHIKHNYPIKASSTGNLYSASVNSYLGEVSDYVNIGKPEHRKSVTLEPVLLSYKSSNHLSDFDNHNLRNFSSCGTFEMCNSAEGNTLMTFQTKLVEGESDVLPQSDNPSLLPHDSAVTTKSHSVTSRLSEEAAIKMLPSEFPTDPVSERNMPHAEKCIKFLSEHNFNEQSKQISIAQTERKMQLSVSPVISKYPSSSSPISSLCSTECDSAIETLSPDEEWPEMKPHLDKILPNKDPTHKTTNTAPPLVVITDYGDSTNDPVEVSHLRGCCDPLNASGRKLSNCSVASDVSDYSTISTCSSSEESSPKYHWKKIRSAVTWSPFLQQLKKRKYPWVQLAGHQGCFQAGEHGTILKKLNTNEQKCYEVLENDNLTAFIPAARGEVVKENGEKFLQLEDLLAPFDSPCVMDVKMGIRTYLEDELKKARENPKLRSDMYEKMVDIDPSAPTPEEQELRAISKPRYMQWRENISSSSSLGFRIEGVKNSNGVSSKDFKRTRTWEQVQEVFQDFTSHNKAIMSQYVSRLKEIRPAVENSKLFKDHEVIGSSLLFVHNSLGKTGVWLIDFGKTTPLPKNIVTNHRNKWVEGNHEDGYLFGLDNLISLMEELLV
ncbi:inositol-trisphosphate 3-kinase A-like isoform X2 [Octopus sinensis]|uniref:Kinase n=1 Tax=Octopus sinensis TaxID=2607531 RepID=A0A6P7SVY2_9MOLL|nr:inositol-trisphosphate 3-kinase A-like isoform X2 [Octopus sinensis]